MLSFGVLVLVLLMLRANLSKSCADLEQQKGAKQVHSGGDDARTVGLQTLQLTYFNFNNQTDSISVEEKLDEYYGERQVTFSITVTRDREMVEEEGGVVRINFFVREGTFTEFCYRPTGHSEGLVSLQSAVAGEVSDSKDFFFTLFRRCPGADTPQTVTSTPMSVTEISVALSVNIQEPLEVHVVSRGITAVRVSVPNIRGEAISQVQCFLNDIEITNSEHFSITHIKRKTKPADRFRRVRPRTKSLEVRMLCWLRVYRGTMKCKVTRSAYTYWSRAHYVSRPEELAECQKHEAIRLSDGEQGGVRLSWECAEEPTSYTIHINRTVAEKTTLDNMRDEWCPIRLHSNSCSLVTDQINPGTPYKVWVTSTDNRLVTDLTDVLVSNVTEVVLARISDDTCNITWYGTRYNSRVTSFYLQANGRVVQSIGSNHSVLLGDCNHSEYNVEIKQCPIETGSSSPVARASHDVTTRPRDDVLSPVTRDMRSCVTVWRGTVSLPRPPKSKLIARVVGWVVFGVVMMGVALGVALGVVFRRRCKKRRRRRRNEVILNKEDMDKYETSDIVILHIRNTEIV